MAIRVVATNDSLIWPGDIRQSADNWVPVYEKVIGGNQGVHQIFIQEFIDPLDPAMAVDVGETLVSQTTGVCYDPTCMWMPNKDFGIVYTRGQVAYWVKRLRRGTYQAPVVLMSASAIDRIGEVQGFGLIQGKTFITYNKWQSPFTVDDPKDACIREVIGSDPIALGPEVVIAPFAVTAGRDGAQDRIALLNGGIDGVLLAAWNGNPNGENNRRLMIARSTDLGKTWGPVESITVPGDCVDPTGTYVSKKDIRFYFAQGYYQFPLGMVKSTDNGATWVRSDVTQNPARTGNVHCEVRKSGNKIFCFNTANHQTELWIYELEEVQ